MLENVNVIAMLVATIASMAIGAAWYSVLSKNWIAAVGFTDAEQAQVASGGSPVIYIIAAVCHLIMAYILSGVIYHTGEFTVWSGVISGFLIWAGFVLTSMVVNHRFQMKSWMLTAIDSGHYLIVLLAQGAILGWFGIA